VGSGPGVWEVDATTGHAVRPLTSDGDEPSLSPDEKTLVFVRRSPFASEIWTAAGDGTAPRRLLAGAGSVWRFPVFSASGTALFFFEVRQAPGPLAGSAILFRTTLSGRVPVPFGPPLAFDPASRPSILSSGGILVRSWGEGTALMLDPPGESVRRMPFGAALSALAAPPDGRAVVTRAGNGVLVLWRRY
jgi:Tol biopolymer transport system component